MLTTYCTPTFSSGCFCLVPPCVPEGTLSFSAEKKQQKKQKPWNHNKDIALVSPNFWETCSQIVHVSVALRLWLRGFLGSPAEVEENRDVRRGTEWWRWQIAEARRASSITPCGYTMWLSSPQETWCRFHLYETGVFGGVDEHFRCIFYCYPSLKKVRVGRVEKHFLCLLVHRLSWITLK